MRILIGLLMLGVTSIACSQTSQQPFTITVSTNTLVVKSGDNVSIEVVMSNISDHAVDCTIDARNVLDRNYRYDVLDEGGQPVPKIKRRYPDIGESGSIRPCIIKPGETSLPSGGLISILYDFRRPGKYTIQVSRGVPPDPDNLVKSNIVTITVVGPEAPPAEPK
jgi:hypothetical protein